MVGAYRAYSRYLGCVLDPCLLASVHVRGLLSLSVAWTWWLVHKVQTTARATLALPSSLLSPPLFPLPSLHYPNEGHLG